MKLKLPELIKQLEDAQLARKGGMEYSIDRIHTVGMEVPQDFCETMIQRQMHIDAADKLLEKLYALKA